MNFATMIHADRDDDKVGIAVKDRRDNTGKPYYVLAIEESPGGGALSVFLSPARLEELHRTIGHALLAAELERNAAAEHGMYVLSTEVGR